VASVARALAHASSQDRFVRLPGADDDVVGAGLERHDRRVRGRLLGDEEDGDLGELTAQAHERVEAALSMSGGRRWRRRLGEPIEQALDARDADGLIARRWATNIRKVGGGGSGSAIARRMGGLRQAERA
jgi:hypothetical protein